MIIIIIWTSALVQGGVYIRWREKDEEDKEKEEIFQTLWVQSLGLKHRSLLHLQRGILALLLFDYFGYSSQGI